MLPVPLRVDQLKLNHMYNIVNGISPHYLRGEVLMAGNHGHNIRSGNRACFVPRVNSFAIKSFFYTGVKLWNALPFTTQIITNKQAFKSEVKKVLCSNTRELVLLIICPTLRSVIKATQWLKRTERSSKSVK